MRFELELAAGVFFGNSPENRENPLGAGWVPFPEDVSLATGEEFVVRFSWCGGRLAARRVVAP
ncbi:hypothetical protein [Actinophytocola xanthii]|uniref:Uncharacterized protein n=1 Tax=Actinophytocola xanthii TaxID=1912961 RepID=A0A1Q8C6G2_9PSEU|nr:hypothetical protein [Actinophytocola xanthii]OLF09931.1 hypothetical protein BU204_32470 [Actinophytocola xanthii]